MSPGSRRSLKRADAVPPAATASKWNSWACPEDSGPLHAIRAERAGFKAFFVAGSQTAACLLGVPDIGILGARDMTHHGLNVANLA